LRLLTTILLLLQVFSKSKSKSLPNGFPKHRSLPPCSASRNCSLATSHEHEPHGPYCACTCTMPMPVSCLALALARQDPAWRILYPISYAHLYTIQQRIPELGHGGLSCSPPSACVFTYLPPRDQRGNLPQITVPLLGRVIGYFSCMFKVITENTTGVW
jgi:hypothetical protein